MNILVSSSRASYYTGGTEVVSMHQAAELASRGHDVTFAVRQTEEHSDHYTEFLKKIRDDELSISIAEVAINAPYGNGHSWAVWNEEAAAFGMAAQEVYLDESVRESDLTVAHMATDSLFMPEYAPHALHLHGSPKQNDALIELSMTRPNHSIAHSTSIKSWWSEFYPDMPMDTFRNGVPVERFAGDPDKNRSTDILYVGRLLEHKGILDILSAATPDQSLIIAGSGVLRAQIEAIIIQRQLNAQVIDNPTNDELVELYQDAKIFACPSKAKEGVLTTMLEAGAAGCAVVTATGSGMSDLAVDGENSRLITPGNHDELGRVFQELLSDDAKRVKIARNMFEIIQNEWSWQAKAKELESIYEKVSTTY